MSIIRMYVAASAATAAVASIDIPADGVIRAITMGVSIYDATPVTGEGASAQLSFLSSPQYAANDVRGTLCDVRNQPAHVAAAITLSNGGTPFCVMTPIAVHVAAGERVYLHCTPEGSVVATAVAYLFIDDGIDVARAQVRRR